MGKSNIEKFAALFKKISKPISEKEYKKLLKKKIGGKNENYK